MQSTIVRYVIFRGRFQPFTRVHYECIKTFFRESLTPEETTHDDCLPWLILCIVRDYETLGSEYRLLTGNPSAERFFRHLFLFNPFSILECEREIHVGIDTYLEEDRSKTPRDKFFERFKSFLHTRLFTEALPIKFQHLIEVHSRTVSPSDKEKTYQTIVAAFRDPESPSSEEGRTARNLAKFLCCLTKELTHMGENQRVWLVPIFDYEDITDSRMLITGRERRIEHSNEGQFLAPRYCYTPTLPQSLDFKERFDLSVIGTCIYYAYLQWLQKRPPSLCDSQKMKNDINNAQSFIKQFVRKECLEAYERGIDAKISQAQTRWDDSTLTDSEHAILCDPVKFFSMARVYLAVPQKKSLEKQINEPFSTEEIASTRREPLTSGKQVFISYSQKDRKYLDQLLAVLKPSVRASEMTLWWDKPGIRGGTLWYEEIQKGVATSQVAVLLVTVNFIASEFIVNEEFRLIKAAAEKNKLRILWIPWTKAQVETLGLQHIQALHPRNKPLATLPLPKRLEALNDIALDIVTEIKGYTQQL